MRLLMVFATVLLLVSCSGDGDSDGGLDGPLRDYPKIEGPNTNPIKDIPLSPDMGVDGSVPDIPSVSTG